ncbi:MAG: hypothetical protein ABI778_03010 [Ignavibacteriota bacterium]
MKSAKLSLVAVLFLLSAAVTLKPVMAQVDMDTLPFKHFEVGPFFTAGLSVFQGDVPEGAKTDVHFAFSGGALLAYSFHQSWGVALGLGYESRGIYFHKEAVEIPNIDFTLNYFSIQPSIKFKQFLLGVNIGLPLSGKSKWNTGYPAPAASSVEGEANKDSLNTMIDIRAQGLLPIVENDDGALYFVINASYNVSDALKNFVLPFQNDFSKPVTKSPIPTLQLGLSYMLAPGGKTH